MAFPATERTDDQSGEMDIREDSLQSLQLIHVAEDRSYSESERLSSDGDAETILESLKERLECAKNRNWGQGLAPQPKPPKPHANQKPLRFPNREPL
jgi:hypothetical protein